MYHAVKSLSFRRGIRVRYLSEVLVCLLKHLIPNTSPKGEGNILRKRDCINSYVKNVPCSKVPLLKERDLG